MDERKEQTARGKTLPCSQGWASGGLRQMSRYRELLSVLTVRNMQMCDRQSVLRIGWAVLQSLPLMPSLTFSVLPLLAKQAVSGWMHQRDSSFSILSGEAHEIQGPDLQGLLPLV